MKRNAAMILLTLLTIGCDYGDSEFRVAENNFFPLQVGNYWELRPFAQNPTNDQVVTKMTITGTETFAGVEYYCMVTTSESPIGVYIDSAYYRMDGNGFVFRRTETGDVSNPYRLGADDGASWRLSSSSTEDDMTVTFYSTPVEIGSLQLENCRLFSYDVENWADEESYTTLAPGIGIVTMHSAWGFRKDLKKAMVNGVEYNF